MRLGATDSFHNTICAIAAIEPWKRRSGAAPADREDPASEREADCHLVPAWPGLSAGVMPVSPRQGNAVPQIAIYVPPAARWKISDQPSDGQLYPGRLQPPSRGQTRAFRARHGYRRQAMATPGHRSYGAGESGARMFAKAHQDGHSGPARGTPADSRDRRSAAA